MQYQELSNEIVDNSDESFLYEWFEDSEVLFICFGFYIWQEIPGFDFYKRLKKVESLTGKKINKLLVRDNKQLWYQFGVEGLGQDVDEVVRSLRVKIDEMKPKKVITIGQSMGAYAAIMFGTLLNVDHIMAFGTLAFFDTKKFEALNDFRWHVVAKEVEDKNPQPFYNDLVALLRGAEKKPKTEIFFGTKIRDNENDEVVNLDSMHSMMFYGLKNVNLYPYPEATHIIVEYLRQKKMLDDLIIQRLSV